MKRSAGGAPAAWPLAAAWLLAVAASGPATAQIKPPAAGQEVYDLPAGGPAVSGGFGTLPRAGGAPPAFLPYQYSIGTESDITYTKDADLDRQTRDNSLIAAPQVNGYILYRPNARVEALLEMILEREYAWKEEAVVQLPGGGTQTAPRRRPSLLIDQALITFKELGPALLTLGRRNFEDDRHWLYDTSLDTAFVRARLGNVVTDVALARKDWFDGDLAQKVPRGRTTDTLVHVEYRGIEDHRIAAYAIRRDDKAGQGEGDPLHLGLRASGAPDDRFSYWAGLGWLRGRDETGQRLRGHAVDAGLIYRFPSLPWRPSLLFGYASGSGDGDPDDGVNRQFRQTGLHSNEFRAAGVSKFKYYGEVLDPDLSNLRIVSLGIGFRPVTGVFVDVMWHRYTLHHLADEVRNAGLTALMNQDDSQLSRRVGQELDVVIGLRNLFGVRRLGVDIRIGWLLPGPAFRNEITSGPAAGEFRRADRGMKMVVKIWY